ncbi:MAG: Cation/multidrug efflux pump [Armatimonadetes bacterium OLB18]|nr:MAG: Cation/multidrug efflux pump [Armatimonadetes bacterium OLB18]
MLSGSAETFKESFQSLMFVLWLGVIVAYMVLGSQYNSFIHPFTVLLALPFSVSGAWLALYLTDQSLNIYSFIGVILLMGIVKKNSILLVDFTNQRREAGLDKTAALLSACPQRLRPVLMTSFATLAAAVPPAFGTGRRFGDPRPDGDGHHRRRLHLDPAHPLRSALRLQPVGVAGAEKNTTSRSWRRRPRRRGRTRRSGRGPDQFNKNI